MLGLLEVDVLCVNWKRQKASFCHKRKAERYTFIFEAHPVQFEKSPFFEKFSNSALDITIRSVHQINAELTFFQIDKQTLIFAKLFGVWLRSAKTKQIYNTVSKHN